jgi:hypothetical protein
MYNCDRFNSCKNSGSACSRCRSYALYRPKPRLKSRSKKEGMSFQTRVQQRHKDITGEEGRQTPNSGAIWSHPGDYVTERDLVECKERKLNARGEKSFTITKDILNKIEKEAAGSKRGIVAFGFKGSDDIYCIAKYDLWLEMAQQIDMLQKELEKYDRPG